MGKSKPNIFTFIFPKNPSSLKPARKANQKCRPLVKPGELYYFNAVAIRNKISSGTSIRGYRTPPLPVSGLSVSDVTNSSFLLNWTLPNLEQTEFDKIEIYEAGQKLATLSKNSNSFLFENYEPSHLALLHVFTGIVRRNRKIKS